MTRIFIDVDGVLNADRGYEGYFDTSAMGFLLKLNKAHAEWLLELSESTGAELCWGTTWEDHANEYIGPAIGLPELPVAHFASKRERNWFGFAKWKADGVIELANGEPFAWFDDESTIGEYLDKNHGDLNYYFCHVSPLLGLRKKHIESVRSWINSLQ
jgi:hypothetical protein